MSIFVKMASAGVFNVKQRGGKHQRQRKTAWRGGIRRRTQGAAARWRNQPELHLVAASENINRRNQSSGRKQMYLQVIMASWRLAKMAWLMWL
jgi:hypothetical protein